MRNTPLDTGYLQKQYLYPYLYPLLYLIVKIFIESLRRFSPTEGLLIKIRRV